MELIHEAEKALHGKIIRTPVEYSPALSELIEAPAWLKLDHLQITGSFKYRGALFALTKLKEEGVDAIATCSAGNHGRALARAARDLGISAKIFVPKGVDQTKYDAMVSMGADVIRSEFIGYDDTEQWAFSETARLGLQFLSAYDDQRVMAGNGGTVALEVAEQVPGADTFIMPAGGGGHSAGFSFAMASMKPEGRFVLCQHAESPALRLSLEQGTAVREMPAVDTLAAGIEGGFGEHTYDVIKDLNPVLTHVSEDDIRQAMIWMLDKHQYVIEGSSAVAVAAAMKKEYPAPAGDVVVFISGRNLSLDTLRSVICA